MHGDHERRTDRVFVHQLERTVLVQRLSETEIEHSLHRLAGRGALSVVHDRPADAKQPHNVVVVVVRGAPFLLPGTAFDLSDGTVIWLGEARLDEKALGIRQSEIRLCDLGIDGM